MGLLGSGLLSWLVAGTAGRTWLPVSGEDLAILLVGAGLGLVTGIDANFNVDTFSKSRSVKRMIARIRPLLFSFGLLYLAAILGRGIVDLTGAAESIITAFGSIGFIIGALFGASGDTIEYISTKTGRQTVRTLTLHVARGGILAVIGVGAVAQVLLLAGVSALPIDHIALFGGLLGIMIVVQAQTQP